MARRMRFGTWCRKDIKDETKIVYIFKTLNDGEMYFTSDEEVSYSMLGRLRWAWIEKIERVTNGFSDHWLAVLYEDGT